MLKILIFLCTSFAWAQAPLVYEIAGSSVAFKAVNGLVINKACQKTCLAYKKGMNAASIKIPSRDLTGGKNPASVRCRKYLDGVVVMGRSQEGHQQSFCLFKDASYLKN